MKRRYVLPLTEMIDKFLLEEYNLAADYISLEIKPMRDYDLLYIDIDPTGFYTSFKSDMNKFEDECGI